MKLIRPSTAEERTGFMSLWAQFLLETYNQGGDVIPSMNNLAFFSHLVLMYEKRPDLGIAVLAFNEDLEMPVGAGLWGVVSNPPVLELRHGPVANGWGIYVLPAWRKSGVSKAIRAYCVQQLLRAGFHSVVGSTALKNTASYESSVRFGFIPTHVQGFLDLNQFRELHTGSLEQGLQE